LIFAVLLDNNDTLFLYAVFVNGRVLNCFNVFKLNGTFVNGLGFSFRDTTLCGTALVEGTKSKLRSRFTDGLGCNNANGLTDFNRLVDGEIGAIAF